MYLTDQTKTEKQLKTVFLGPHTKNAPCWAFAPSESKKYVTHGSRRTWKTWKTWKNHGKKITLENSWKYHGKMTSLWKNEILSPELPK